MNKSRIIAIALHLMLGGLAIAQNGPNLREQKVRQDRLKVEADGFWIYNDLDRAFRLAEKQDKPVLVVLRCIPCEECVKLDDDLVDNDPVLKPLLQQFVCVRVVGTNGLDLDLFQYDTDQSFAVFMLNADKTVYGRFGTRSHRTQWLDDVSLEGMAQALSGALELHDNYPANRTQLAGKRGDSLEFGSPEKFPSLASKYTDKLNYEGDVVKSCIHCHQIGEARREYYWHKRESIPEQLLHPYPHPKSLGLILDPTRRATVKAVTPDSPTSHSGLKPNDEIVFMNDQAILSTADVQWVLHRSPGSECKISMTIKRNGELLSLQLQLPNKWRTLDDTSWRASAWQLSRIALGGMRLESPTDSTNMKAILQVKSVGKFGAHATAMNKGVQKGDLILDVDGRKDLASEASIVDYVNQTKRIGDLTKFRIVRNGEIKMIELPVQD